MSSTYAIEFKDVCKKFPHTSRYAVDHVSLSIKQGEFVTILGTSGSGKTTLMKMVNLLYDITEGDILFYGKSIKGISPVEHRRKIGYVVQGGGLFPHMTVEENIAVVPHILKWNAATIAVRVDEMLRTIHLDPEMYRKRYPRQLSGGQQQRVGVARAMVTNPPVILMDEPFGAIDAITRAALQKEVKQLQADKKMTILFVTHDIQEAFLLGDRVIVMDNGQIQQFDTPDNIVLHPANDYVRQLIQADSPIERLKAISLHALMVPLAQAPEKMPEHKVASTAAVIDVLPLFMKNRDSVLGVTDASGKILGTVGWDQISKAFQ